MDSDSRKDRLSWKVFEYFYSTTIQNSEFDNLVDTAAADIEFRWPHEYYWAEVDPRDFYNEIILVIIRSPYFSLDNNMEI